MQISKRLVAIILAICLCLTVCVSAMQAPPDMPMGEGGMPGGPGMGGPGMGGPGMGGPGMGGPGMGGPGMGGASVSEAELTQAEAIVYGPYETLTIQALKYADEFKDYVDSTLFAQITGVTTDQGEFSIDSSLYVPVLVVNGTSYNLTELVLPYTATGTVELVAVNKGMYVNQGSSKFGADAGSQIGNLYFVPTVYVADGTYKSDRSIAAGQLNGTVTDTEARDVSIVSENGYLSGFYISDSDYTITNANVKLTGKGSDDFTGGGSGLVAKGSANVTVNNSYFETEGVLRSGIWAGDNANVYINDTVVLSHNDFDFIAYNTDDNYATPMMQQVPFALGMTGNIRATLVCGNAKNWFKNSLVVSSGWAVLSTDSGKGGLESTDTVAVLGFAEPYDEANASVYTDTAEVNGSKYGFVVGTSDTSSAYCASGYIAYCDGFTDYAYGSKWYAPDYLAIITGGSLTFDRSENGRGYGFSDRIGFMTHQTKGASITLANSDFAVADTFFMTKNKSGNYDEITIDGITLDLFGKDAWSGVIYQLMDSDDLGNGPGATSYTIPYYTYEDYLAGNGTPAATTTLSIKNSQLKGDVFNATAYYEGASSTAALALTLDSSGIEGTISSSYAVHVDADGLVITGGDDKTFTVDCYTGTGTGGPDGETYDYLTIGRIVNTAAPTRGNPVSVSLTNGSVWTVTGESYLSELHVDDTSKVIGTITELAEGGYLVTAAGEKTASATPLPADVVIVPTTQKMLLNAKRVTPAAYNINGYNYFTIDEITALISGVEPGFTASDEKLADLNFYSIDGKTYYKLRDLGEALGFAVDFDSVCQQPVLIYSPGYAAVENTDEQSITDMQASSYATLDPDTSRTATDAGHIYIGLDIEDGKLIESESNWTAEDTTAVVLDETVHGPGFTALRASGEATDVTVTGKLNLHDETSGYYASDFTGTGAAVVATDQARVFATALDLTTSGFVRAAFLSYKGAEVYIDDSSIVTYGADPLTEAYDGYVNSATTSKMISPPWVLGIQGGIRTVNVLGDSATLIITNSSLASGGWGVLSTDGCSNPAFYIVDSELKILSESENGMNSGYALFGYDADAYGSGYGSYVIGAAKENFYGVTINGATYGAIAREGTAIYQSSTGEIDLKNAQGEVRNTITGKGAPTVFNTVFGFLSHSGEDVAIEVKDGSIINTEEASFLYKTSATAEYIVDNAQLNSKSGILLQMIDDDDSTVGMGDMRTMGFNTALNEDAGLPSTTGNVTGSDGNSQVVMTLTNGVYNGDLYNGTGYYSQGADVLNLNVGEGAVLTGDVALTETIHGLKYSAAAVEALKNMGEDVSYVLMRTDFSITDNEDEAAYIQLTSFSINQYYCLGHVLNSRYYNGNSAANVSVQKGGAWTVTDNSLITFLKIEEGGTVYASITENADGTLTLTPSDTALAPGEYGTQKLADTTKASGANAMSPGMMGGAMGAPGGGMEPPGGFGGGPGGMEPPGGFGGGPGGMPPM